MEKRPQPIENTGSDPDSLARRSGGSIDDPHGGVEMMPHGHPDPDPLDEMATIGGSGRDERPDSPRLARQMGPQPGFGPDETTPPMIEGDPGLGIDPREAARATGDGRKRGE